MNCTGPCATRVPQDCSSPAHASPAMLVVYVFQEPCITLFYYLPSAPPSTLFSTREGSSMSCDCDAMLFCPAGISSMPSSAYIPCIRIKPSIGKTHRRNMLCSSMTYSDQSGLWSLFSVSVSVWILTPSSSGRPSRFKIAEVAVSFDPLEFVSTKSRLAARSAIIFIVAMSLSKPITSRSWAHTLCTLTRFAIKQKNSRERGARISLGA
mmetsp:Transcript_13848/g.26405  ORF Transcript_13848/g.26405 Transcript_13848/m.26405 type:complete len:209 (-) Transcript_13848:58-684(-)